MNCFCIIRKIKKHFGCTQKQIKKRLTIKSFQIVYFKNIPFIGEIPPNRRPCFVSVLSFRLIPYDLP